MTEPSILSPEHEQVLRDLTRSLNQLTAGPGHVPLTLAILTGDASLEAISEALVVLTAYLHGLDFPTPTARRTWAHLQALRARLVLN